MGNDDLGPWEPLSPAQVAGLFTEVRSPWWIAGGYAIELFVGRAYRDHGDIDVLLLRRDQGVAHDVLPGWDVQAADPPGTLRPWPVGERLPTYVHDIWCRETRDTPWRLQFMLDEADGDTWQSRRDDRIRRPVASLGVVIDGVPVLRPEVQLFYKAKSLRPKDEQDFAAALPLLDAEARGWLDEALEVTAPEHPWRTALAANRDDADLRGSDVD